MPHLDEGALWIRATMPYTISFDEASKLGPQLRTLLRGFPQVTTVANELGRPDDGTDPIGFFNDEYFVGLKPYDDPAWQGAIRTKPELINAIQQKLAAFPGIIFNYTQPAEDAVDEAETGLKSSLAVKIFGPDLETLEQQGGGGAPGHLGGARHHPRHRRARARPAEPDDHARPRQDGALRVERRRHQHPHRDGDRRGAGHAGDPGRAVLRPRRAARRSRSARTWTPSSTCSIATPDGQHLPLSQFADIAVSKGASFIYREGNSRFIGIQFSVEGRDLASAVQEAKSKVAAAVPLPFGYTFDWGGEYQEYLAARSQMMVIIPLTVAIILLILFALYGNLKFPLIIIFSVLVTVPVGGLLALKLTGTNFSVSSGFGFVALMGVAVQTSVILYSFINKLRLEGKDIRTATLEASMLRLRPILMTALVACFGLLPAAMSTGIGSDSQRPFAIVIVGGLISRLALSIFLAPVLYLLVARDQDVLKV